MKKNIFEKKSEFKCDRILKERQKYFFVSASTIYGVSKFPLNLAR